MPPQGGDELKNISFFTYAKLMLMNLAEILDIRPDYIVLDEFHRCGAEMWGKCVQALLSVYPDAPILGLSATNIRYQDNQRDMADELFDGNVASEMTLGEAIVRGVLQPQHMTDRTGKYLVFCAKAELMDEMIARVPEWFGKIDPVPHVYRAYSEYPQTPDGYSLGQRPKTS